MMPKNTTKKTEKSKKKTKLDPVEKKIASTMEDIYMRELEKHRKFLDENSHSVGDLMQWYIESVFPPDAPPVWTEEHLEELVQDFWLIGRPMAERGRHVKKSERNVDRFATPKKAQAAFLAEFCRDHTDGLGGNCDLGPSCEKDCMACIVKWLYAKTKHGKNNV